MSDLDNYLAEQDYTLTEEQYAFCDDVIYGEGHVANFSSAGVGKSLCLEVIKGVMKDRCVVCSTTGISNSILFNNKGGQGTCASVFSLPLSIHNAYHEKKVGSKTTQLFAGSDIVQVVIIEESGMLNPDQLALVCKRITRYNRPYGKKRKRRDMKLVLLGDFLQCGCVLPKQEEINYMRDVYGSEHLFESSVFKDLNFNTHIFTINKRSTDKVFRAALDVLRYGEEHRYDGVLKWLNKRYIAPPSDTIKIATTNARVDELNKEALEINPNRPVTFTAKMTGDYKIKDCPADEVIILKEGIPVLSLMNDQDGNFFNGSHGHVTGFSVGDGVYVKFTHSGEEHLVPYFEYDSTEYFTNKDEDGKPFMDSKKIGGCTQLAVKVCASMSVHRCQGKSIDVPVELDLGWGFSPREDRPFGEALAFVAISRLTTIENLYLKQPLTRKHLKVNRKAVEWVLNQTK